ncbi:uncharacterized protein LOC135139503 isoform X3 [Zophobas morio]|uniref:uncharacterized protein LOC135139503 isoform X3 n=1 Tax=Zophobas morio TaxID=2755281 RepID=UPI0030836D7B
MCLLKDYHSKFTSKALESSQLLQNNIYSSIPTVVFLVSSFIFLYQHLHRNTTLHTRWKTRIIRDLKFHWIYFNASRLWYIFISCCKRLISVAEDYIDLNLADAERYFNRVLTQGAALTIVTTLSVIPVILIYVNYMSKYDMPNFLMCFKGNGRPLSSSRNRHLRSLSGTSITNRPEKIEELPVPLQKVD